MRIIEEKEHLQQRQYFVRDRDVSAHIGTAIVNLSHAAPAFLAIVITAAEVTS